MKQLTIDTATSWFAAALMDGTTCVAKASFEVARDHSSFAMPAIVALFNEVKWQMSDIEQICVTQGPGSYTGIRIAVTLAKTFAYAQNIPLVGVSTLHLLAANCEQEGVLIVPIIDAKRQEVFTGFYTYQAGNWDVLEADSVKSVTALVEQLKRQSLPVVFVGKDAQLFSEAFADVLMSSVSTRQATDGEKLAKIAMTYPLVSDVHTFAPNYFKLSQAEADLLKREGEKNGI